ncbi:hypothetical protein BOTCAL_0532g00070 [Botryotinia calthae]|uniref:Uncharacterized protein n=1 Tax=Botryotinia calthae TaxID=38488 RepID=A0A4Y8CN65_9HELO|nr:hypothetical protein BOTCAL_0532g00070 [Botryotinia calthae]
MYGLRRQVFGCSHAPSSGHGSQFNSCFAASYLGNQTGSDERTGAGALKGEKCFKTLISKSNSSVHPLKLLKEDNPTQRTIRNQKIKLWLCPSQSTLMIMQGTRSEIVLILVVDDTRSRNTTDTLSD